MPLGNATIGEQVWHKGEEYSFEWVKEHVRRGDYGPVKENRLYLNNALCEGNGRLLGLGRDEGREDVITKDTKPGETYSISL